MTHDEDVHYIHLPLLLWWAIEAKVSTDPDAVLKLFENHALWDRPIVARKITERLMRRFAAAGTRKDLDRCARLLVLAPDARHGKALMAGFEAAFAGRSLAGLPQPLVDALAHYSGQSVTLGLRRGKPEAIAEALNLLGNEQGDRAKQLQYLQILGEIRVSGATPVLLKLACHSPDNALRAAALGALVNYDDPAIATEVLKTCGSLSDDLQAAAQGLLVSRRVWAIQLLDAIEDRTIDPRTVPRETAEKLLLLGDERIKDRVTHSSVPSRRPPRPSSRRRSSIWRLWCDRVPEFPSRASKSSRSSVPAATRFSARAETSGPT